MSTHQLMLMPEQESFILSNKPIIAYIGGIGAGKSWIACVKAVKNALGGRNQLMVGLTFSHARDVLLDTLKKVLDLFGLIDGGHYKINKSNLEIQIINNTKIYIKSAEIGDKLRGYNVADVYIDESAYLKDDTVFRILLGRMREVNDAQLHLTTSPRGYNWVYDIAQQDDCDYIKVSTFKNPFLPDNYIKNMLKQYTRTYIQQELYADFVNISSGLFRAEWIKDFASNEQIIKDYGKAKRVRFWDFAFSEEEGGDYSAGVLLAKIDDNYVIEDIVRVKQKYTDLRKTIIKTAIQDGRDVQIGFEQAGQQKGIIDDLSTIRELSLYTTKPLKVSKYGHKLKRIMPLASLAENGHLYISQGCKNKNEIKNECNALTMDDSHTNDDMVDACASAYILFNSAYNNAQGHRTNIY